MQARNAIDRSLKVLAKSKELHPMKEMRILSPTAILGYGFPEDSFREGLRRDPHVIAVDAGSTDPGPYYLGAGECFTAGAAVKRDLEILLAAVVERGIPLLIGTAGGSGGRPHVERDLSLIRKIACEKGLHFKMALIQAEVGPEKVINYLRQGRVTPLGPAPALSEEEVGRSARIVGQMGVEPLMKALSAGAQVVLAGRCYDPAVFAAPAIEAGFDPGLALHLGKIMECGAIAAVPGSGSDCLYGRLERDCFEVEPTTPARQCTEASIAAHTLYEKSNPLLLPGPGGMIDLNASSFEQSGGRAVRVAGSRFIPAEKYTVKLEGVKKAGYRTVSIAGCRDPIMIRQIDELIGAVRERVTDNFRNAGLNFFLDFRLYGKDGVMGALEPQAVVPCHELGIVIEAVAGTQEAADAVCSFARSTMLHTSYPGRLATAGNLAFPFSPSDFRGGEVYRFNIYHLVEVNDPLELFSVELIDL